MLIFVYKSRQFIVIRQQFTLSFQTIKADPFIITKEKILILYAIYDYLFAEKNYIKNYLYQNIVILYGTKRPHKNHPYLCDNKLNICYQT